MRFVFIITILFSTLFAKARQQVAYDSSAIEQRNFAPASFDKYKTDRDFQYENELVEMPSLWDRFWMWFWNKYEDIMSTPAGRTTMNIVYWVLGLGAIGFFVYRVMRMNKVALFINPSLSNNTYTVEDENIHSISFDAAIHEALLQGNYRLAVRLSYLQSLKILSDKNLITWQPNKTNTDYLSEVSRTGVYQPFKHITNIFEYAWYGNLTVSRNDYEEMKEQFSQFQSQL